MAIDAESENITSIVPIQLDVTNEKHIQACYDSVLMYMRKFDKKFSGLVNNAGVSMRSTSNFIYLVFFC